MNRLDLGGLENVSVALESLSRQNSPRTVGPWLQQAAGWVIVSSRLPVFAALQTTSQEQLYNISQPATLMTQAVLAPCQQGPQPLA